MKNLDLNAYGVSEMNHQEMVEIDGGGDRADKALAVIGAVTLIAGVAIAAVATSGVSLAITGPTSLGIATATLVKAFKD